MKKPLLMHIKIGKTNQNLNNIILFKTTQFMGCFLLPRINLGNIIRKFEYAYTTTATDNLSNGTVIAYTYPSAGWKDQLASYNNESIVYDELGNPVNYRGNILSWSHGRQLDKFNDNAYKYNADGIRTSKTISGVTTQFYLDGTKLLAQSDGNLLLFHYGNEGVIGFTYQGVGTYYYKKNILGDIIGILDSNGQIIAKYTYDAWGNHKIYIQCTEGFVDISSKTSYTQTELNNKFIAEINPFRYRSLLLRHRNWFILLKNNPIYGLFFYCHKLANVRKN